MADITPTLWLCSGGGRTVTVLARHPVSWHDVRQFASTKLFVDNPACEIVQQGKPQYELSWTGSDAGYPPTRRMVVEPLEPGSEL